MKGCPSRDQLELLLSDPSGDGVPEELERHVEACAACQQALEAMTATTDWGASPEHRPAADASTVTEPESFLRRLQQSPPWTIDSGERLRDTVRDAEGETSRPLEPGREELGVTAPDAEPSAAVDPQRTAIDTVTSAAKNPAERGAPGVAGHGHHAGEPILARRISGSNRPWGWFRRNPVVAGLVGFIALTLISGTTVAICFASRANQKAIEAMDIARRAVEEAQRARDANRLSEERLYLAEIHLAEQAWQKGRPDLAQHELQLIEPRRPEDPDPRGFEWYYLDRLSQSVLHTLSGHTSSVRDVKFSPDGRTLASASDDRTVKLWDAATGRDVSTLHGHREAVHGVAYSPDGRLIASASADQTVKVWDADTGQEIRTLRGHVDVVRGVAYGPDGRLIASASADRTVQLWDAATGLEVLTLRGHSNAVSAVAFRPDGQHIASASHDQTVRLWDAVTGREVLTLRGHVDRVSAVAYSPDGRRLASASHDHTLKLWDAATGQEVLTLRGHNAGVLGLAFNPDGRRIVSVSDDRTVKLWDAATGQEVLTLRGHSGGVLGVAFRPDGRQIASSSVDQSVKIWDATPLTP